VSNVNNGWSAWVALLSLEGVLMLLMAHKLLSYRNQMNQTITMLARDSIVYFIVISVCLVLNIVSEVDPNILTYNLTLPTLCITSVAVGRMMMNIRGLILDDPEHTVHLRTLQFAAPSNSGSDVEEVA